MDAATRRAATSPEESGLLRGPALATQTTVRPATGLSRGSVLRLLRLPEQGVRQAAIARRYHRGRQRNIAGRATEDAQAAISRRYHRAPRRDIAGRSMRAGSAMRVHARVNKGCDQAAISPQYHCGPRRDIAGRPGRADNAVRLRRQRDRGCTGRDIAAISPCAPARYRGSPWAGRERGGAPAPARQRMHGPQYRCDITVGHRAISRSPRADRERDATPLPARPRMHRPQYRCDITVGHRAIAGRSRRAGSAVRVHTSVTKGCDPGRDIAAISP